MRRARRSLAAAGAVATLTAALTAAPADARPPPLDDERILIVDDRRPPPPPPPPPPPLPEPPAAEPRRAPRLTSLGLRTGVNFAGPARGFTYGLNGAVVLHPGLRATAEYDHVMRFAPDEELPAGMPRLVGGGAHRARLGVRLNLADARIRDVMRLYVDADATAGLALVSGPTMERTLVAESTLGARLGYELLATGRSPSQAFDFHVLLRAVRADGDTGLAFGIGMEWTK